MLSIEKDIMELH